MRLFRLLASFLVAAATACLAVSASAQTSKVDFAGKTITVVVGFGAGGSYDIVARLIADHLGRFLPGHPTVIAENMPGGGGARSVAYMATVAPKDGTVVSVIPGTILMDNALGNLPAGVAAGDFAYVGRLSSPVGVAMTWHTSPTKTVEDAKQRETTMAASGRTAMTSIIPRVFNAIVGTKFKVIEGYEGAAAGVLAMERGEVEGSSTTMPSLDASHPDWIATNQVNVLWQVAPSRDPAYPDIPALMEFAANDAQRALLGLVASEGVVGRSLALPPGVPDEVVATYRSAFDQMVQDPDFLADAKKRNVDLDLTSGSALQDVRRVHVEPAAGRRRRIGQHPQDRSGLRFAAAGSRHRPRVRQS